MTRLVLCWVVRQMILNPESHILYPVSCLLYSEPHASSKHTTEDRL